MHFRSLVNFAVSRAIINFCNDILYFMWRNQWIRKRLRYCSLETLAVRQIVHTLPGCWIMPENACWAWSLLPLQRGGEMTGKCRIIAVYCIWGGRKFRSEWRRGGFWFFLSLLETNQHPSKEDDLKLTLSSFVLSLLLSLFPKQPHALTLS